MSDTEEDLPPCDIYLQTIGESSQNSEHCTWEVGCPAKDELVQLMLSQHVLVQAFPERFKFQVTFAKEHENCFIELQYQAFNSGRFNKEMQPYDQGLRLKVIVMNDHNQIVENINITKSVRREQREPSRPKYYEQAMRGHLPLVTKQILAQKTAYFTFDCCIQLLNSDERAEKVVTGTKIMKIHANCLRALNADLYIQFLNQNMADVTLKCKDRDLHAHKFILMSRWPAIGDKVTFDSSVIDIADTRAEIVEQILKFVYAGTWDEADEDNNIKEVLFAADEYGLLELCKHLCNDRMSKNVTAENALEMVLLSQKHCASDLEASALVLIRQNPSLLEKKEALLIAIQDPDFLHKVYEGSKPTNETKKNGAKFTWEIDCSGDFQTPFSLSSKSFEIWTPNGFTAYLEFKNFDLILNLHAFQDQQAPLPPLFKIRVDVSINGTSIDRTIVCKNKGKIMGMQKLKEKINAKEINLDHVIITCRFLTGVFDKPIAQTHTATYSAGADIYKSLLNKSGVDVKLIAKGEEFEAHKLILSARSSVFAAMFQSGLTEQLTNTVHISDIDGKVLTQLLKFIYTATTDDNMDLTITAQLLFAADKYDLQDLKALCELKLCEELRSDNAMKLMLLAHQHNATDLMANTLAVFKKNYNSVYHTDAYKLFMSENPELSVKMYQYLISEKYKGN